MITCVPEIKKVKLTSDDKFLVIACDGIWDCLTSKQCVEWLGKRIKARKAPPQYTKIVEDMFDKIICEDIDSENN
jgi:serine/threonine protein phosphatase PrpC